MPSNLIALRRIISLSAAQAIGSLAISGATFITALVVMYAINATGLLRVSKEGEMEGLDLHEHGIPAYPEYTLYPSASPRGTPKFNQGMDSVMTVTQKGSHEIS